MRSFTAIDFETASGYRNSICQVGLVRVENGFTTKKVNQLVQPPDNYYWSCFTDIHGIAAKDSTVAPTFDQIWQQSKLYIENQNVIAHNGFGFVFLFWTKHSTIVILPTTDYNKPRTYKIYRSNLATLCKEHNIPVNHHDA